MKIDFGHGEYIESGEQPRTSNWHRRIVRVTPMMGTDRGRFIELECGHHAETFGLLSELNGAVLCIACRDQEHKD